MVFCLFPTPHPVGANYVSNISTINTTACTAYIFRGVTSTKRRNSMSNLCVYLQALRTFIISLIVDRTNIRRYF